MYNEARQTLLDALNMVGVEFEVKRNDTIYVTKGIKNGNEKYIRFLPEAEINLGDTLINVASGEILHVVDLDTLVLERKVVSLKVYYETDPQRKKVANNPTVEKQYQIMRVIDQFEGSSHSNLVDDTEIAKALSSDLQLVRDLLDILEAERKVQLAKSHGDHRSATLTAMGRILLQDPSYATYNSSSTTINFSGNYQGAILNVQSTLNSVSQSIVTSPNLGQDDKETLSSLIDQLDKVLQNVPPDKVEEAEAVADSAKALVDAATKEKPNKTTIKITAEGLKQAAKNLAAVLPEIMSIALEITSRIQQHHS
jgi:hypothetical protein